MSTGGLNIVDTRREGQVSPVAEFSQCEAAHIAAQQTVILSMTTIRSVAQEAIVTTRIPILMRWTEEAEAAQVCALAAFEREPESAAVRAAAADRHALPPHNRQAVLPRLLSWFGGSDAQIKRDED